MLSWLLLELVYFYMQLIFICLLLNHNCYLICIYIYMSKILFYNSNSILNSVRYFNLKALIYILIISNISVSNNILMNSKNYLKGYDNCISKQNKQCFRSSSQQPKKTKYDNTAYENLNYKF